MIKADDLWIGDWVMIKSSGIKGQFNGMDDRGHLLIKTKDHQVLHLPPAELDQIEDEIEHFYSDDLAMTDEPIAQDQPEEDFGDLIDLHYDILSQSFPHRQGSKLEFQLEVCKKFILSAIRSRLMNIQIIHGKGQGILKNEVEILLRQYSEITMISSNPNLASVDAWMNYN